MRNLQSLLVCCVRWLLHHHNLDGSNGEDLFCHWAMCNQASVLTFSGFHILLIVDIRWVLGMMGAVFIGWWNDIWDGMVDCVQFQGCRKQTCNELLVGHHPSMELHDDPCSFWSLCCCSMWLILLESCWKVRLLSPDKIQARKLMCLCIYHGWFCLLFVQHIKASNRWKCSTARNL